MGTYCGCFYLRPPAVCILGTWARLVPVTWGLCDLQLLVPVLFGFSFYFTWHFIPCPGEVLSVEQVCSEFLSMRTGVHQALSCGRQSGMQWKEGFCFSGSGKSPGAELSSESDLTRIVSLCPAAPVSETTRDLGELSGTRPSFSPVSVSAYGTQSSCRDR